jgi:plastocyanin
LNPNHYSKGSSITQREIKTLDYVADSTGTWYIKISRSSGEGDYQLAVNTSIDNDGGPGNNPPVISSLDANQDSIEINHYVGIYCSANDQDGDTLIFSWTANGQVIEGNNSSLSWRAPDTAGTYTITCTVNDSKGGQDRESVSITVTSNGGGPGNYPPVISSLDANQDSIEINHNVDITCNASDQDGDTLIFSWTANGQVIEGNNSSLSWRAPDTAGTYNITCTVSDGRGGEDSESVSITVTTTSGPISTDDIIYLNSPHQIITADFGDSGGSKNSASSGWSDYNEASRSCRAYSLGVGAVFTGGSANYWSKVGKIFDVQQGTYISSSRAVTITINGNYSGRIMAVLLSTSDANLKVVVTDNGTVVANSEIFNKSATVVDWDDFSGSFSKSLSVNLRAGHTYCVYLHLETSATAAIMGSAGADVGEGGKYAGYGGIDISF